MKRSLWPTRDPVKDYFPLPKEIFSLGLSAAAIAIYAYLLFCEDPPGILPPAPDLPLRRRQCLPHISA